MNKGIAIAGNLLVDIIKTIDVFPDRGMLSNIEHVERCVGGCAANTAVNLAKIDPAIPIKVFGGIGADENGQYISEVLGKYRIDIDGVKQFPSTSTSFTDVMTERKEGVRTFFHARGANALFGFDDIDFTAIKAEHFHIGYALLLDQFDAIDSEYGTVMARALDCARKNGMRTSMDVVSESSGRFKQIVTPSLKYCDYVIINEIEASMIAGLPVRKNGKLEKDSLKKICHKLLENGIKDEIIIHMPEGACAMDIKENFLFVPSLNLPENYIKGTVGAGDAFCAGMLFSIHKGYDREHALKIGAGAAACCLSEINSIDGMQGIKEIENLIDQYG